MLIAYKMFPNLSENTKDIELYMLEEVFEHIIASLIMNRCRYLYELRIMIMMRNLLRVNH